MEWVLRKNIERHERLCEEESDPQKQRIVRQLLREELTKLAMLKAGEPKSSQNGSQ